MPRRKTTIGVGSFGNPRPVREHAYEILHNILSRGQPLTEDAVFLSMLNILWQRGSQVFQKVRQSRAIGDYRYMYFSPDIDLLEVRSDRTVVGYELKGERKQGREVVTPPFYEGIDQGLAYLMNPLSSPASDVFAGSIFDHVYMVHPATSEIDRMKNLVERFTPLGLAVVERQGVKELVAPKANPFLNTAIKDYFLAHLDAFETYTTYTVNPIQ